MEMHLDSSAYSFWEFFMSLLLRNLASAVSMALFLFMMLAWVNILALA